MGIVDDVMTAPAWEAEMGKSALYKTIYDAAKSSGINPKEFLQLAQMESGFDTQAVSSQGYHGLFQLNPKDKDIKNYMSRNLPFTSPGLHDPDVNVEFAAKRYKLLGDDTVPFIVKAVKYNQGKKGGGQILDAWESGKSIQETSDAPWNRTKKMLNNMSNDDLKKLTLVHSKNKDVNRSRESMIESMIGTKGSHSSNKAIRNDPNVVQMYISSQQGKVNSSGEEVAKILKEM